MSREAELKTEEIYLSVETISCRDVALGASVAGFLFGLLLLFV